jgi:ABC-type Zn uptake system ZnuABC Zn-binding protein ZnuA
MRYIRLFIIGCLIALGSLSSLAPLTISNAQSANPALQACDPAQPIPTPEVNTPEAANDSANLAIPASPLRIVSTVSPITNIVFNIGGNRMKIHSLIPEGLDSHTFEPKPSNAVFLAEADVVFLNGLHLEEPTLKLAQANLRQGSEIVELGTLTLAEADWIYDFSFPKQNGDPNPHLWMNPLLALNYAEIVRDTLSKRDPEGSVFYAKNYELFAQRITILDQAICAAISTVPVEQRKLLTYHDSFAYFAPRYNVTVIGAIQPSDFAEPSAQEVAKLIDQIKAEGVRAVFSSEVFPSKIIEQIGKEAGVQYVDTLADDDLPNQTGDRRYHSYLQLMVNDVITMTKALGGNSAALAVVPTANLHGSDDAVEVSGE